MSNFPQTPTRTDPPATPRKTWVSARTEKSPENRGSVRAVRAKRTSERREQTHPQPLGKPAVRREQDRRTIRTKPIPVRVPLLLREKDANRVEQNGTKTESAEPQDSGPVSLRKSVALSRGKFQRRRKARLLSLATEPSCRRDAGQLAREARPLDASKDETPMTVFAL